MSAKSVEHFTCLPPVPLNLFDEIPNATTRTTYRRVVTEFASWCSTHNQPLSSATVLDYREHLAKLAFSPSTINQRLSAIRRFVAQAAGSGWISLTLAAEVIRVRGKSVSKVSRAPVLTPYEAERLKGLSSSMINVLWGFFNAVIAYLLIAHVGEFHPRSWSHILPFALGVLLISTFNPTINPFNGVDDHNAIAVIQRPLG